MKKIFFLFLFFPCKNLNAQLLNVTPQFATTEDTVTIIYNAQLGNGDLAGYSGDVFAHSGLITTESQNSSDWKHVVDNWGTFDSATLMESLGNDLYKIKFHIRSFFNVGENEKVLSLAFVFRNQNGSIVGREADGSDIFYDINQQVLGDFQSYTLVGNSIIINADSGSVEIQPYDANMFKVTLVNNEIEYPDSSFSVIMNSSYPNPQLIDETNYLDFSTGNFTVRINKFPIRLSYIFNNDTLLRDEGGLYKNASGSGVRFYIGSNEHIYGTGSRALDIDRKGKSFSSYNTAQYGYSNGATVLNVNIPFVISTKLYGLFFDNFSPGAWDIGGSDSTILQYSSEQGKFSYFVIAGNSNEEILNHYTNLTGKQPLPPRWALGYIQSRFGYESEFEARDIVSQMQSKNFPLDALVLDLYWFGAPSQMGNLNWDYTAFQQPVDMMHDFDSMGIKTICIAEPYITQNSANYNYCNTNHLLATDTFGNAFVIGNFWAGGAGLLDMFSSSSQDWMWSYYNGRIGEGVGAWWSDLGEPENHPESIYHSIGKARTVHNVYSLIWSEMLYKKYQQYHSDTRLFNLSRSGYAGMQRYSTFPWSGDIQRSFSGLQAQIPIMLGMGMCGVGYMHSDIGGFTGGGQNEELYTRWQEMGSFFPIMRAHGEGVPTEPVYYSTTCQNTVRKYSQLRHQLIPYNYSLAYQNSLSGIPLARQINFYEPENNSISNVNDEFLWGENLLVAPVLTQGSTSRSVLFPLGKWISYNNNSQVYLGGSTATVSAALDVLPLFVRAGSFIPMVSLVNSLALYNTDTLIVKYYPDLSVAESSFDIYDDDGKDPLALANENFELISMKGNVNWNEIDISLSKTGNSFDGAPLSREMNFQLQKIVTPPTQALLNNISLPFKNSLTEYYSIDSAVYYDLNAQVLYVHFNWKGDNNLLQLVDVFLSDVKDVIESTSVLKIYPNPASSLLHFEFAQKNNEKAVIEIRNNLSAVVLKFNKYFNAGINNTELDISSLESGSYILQVENSNGKFISKFVKE